MRALIQRVTDARVEIGGEVIAGIEPGLVVFLGIAGTDTEKDAKYLVDKLIGLRIFQDSFGKMNRNIAEAGGSFLVVSQFTLYADCRRGRRPGFDRAAGRELALQLYETVLRELRATGTPVAAGVFQAHMAVHLVNDGPVTIMLDSEDK
jgi:D-aminoacyl-tRNA deacylase